MGTAAASASWEDVWEVQGVQASLARSLQVCLARMDPAVLCLDDAQNLIRGKVELALLVGYDVVEFLEAFHLLARSVDTALELRA